MGARELLLRADRLIEECGKRRLCSTPRLFAAGVRPRRLQDRVRA
jgi:hypothetical protein